MGRAHADDVHLPGGHENLRDADDGVTIQMFGGLRKVVRILLDHGRDEVLHTGDAPGGAFQARDRIDPIDVGRAQVLLHLEKPLEAEGLRQAHDGGIRHPAFLGELGCGHEDHLFGVLKDVAGQLALPPGQGRFHPGQPVVGVDRAHLMVV